MIDWNAVAAVAAVSALGVSLWSASKTHSFNRRQNELFEITEKLSRVQLERETSETVAARRADISANFVNVGRSYRLKVFNKGKGTARNVRLERLDSTDLLMQGDIDEKFPVPILEQHQWVELIAVVHMQSPPRAYIRLTWDDDHAKDNNKELTPSVH
jgi:hypothetical protein